MQLPATTSPLGPSMGDEEFFHADGDLIKVVDHALLDHPNDVPPPLVVAPTPCPAPMPLTWTPNNTNVNGIPPPVAPAPALLGAPVLGAPVLGGPVLGSPVLGSPVLGAPVLGEPAPAFLSLPGSPVGAPVSAPMPLVYVPATPTPTLPEASARKMVTSTPATRKKLVSDIVLPEIQFKRRFHFVDPRIERRHMGLGDGTLWQGNDQDDHTLPNTTDKSLPKSAPREEKEAQKQDFLYWVVACSMETLDIAMDMGTIYEPLEDNDLVEPPPPKEAAPAKPTLPKQSAPGKPTLQKQSAPPKKVQFSSTPATPASSPPPPSSLSNTPTTQKENHVDPPTPKPPLQVTKRETPEGEEIITFTTSTVMEGNTTKTTSITTTTTRKTTMIREVNPYHMGCNIL